MSFPLLDAMLAFALTMLGVATTTNILLSVLRRLFKWRQRIMKKMLDTFFATQLEATIGSVIRQVSATLPANASRTGRDGLGNERVEVAEQLKAFIESSGIDHVSAESLVESIRASDLGQKLQTAFGASVDDLMNRISSSFDELGVAITRKFEDFSRLWSFLWAIIVAFIINVNSIDILQTYLTSDAARNAVIAQQDLIVKRYNTHLEQSPSDDADLSLKMALAKTKEEIQTLQSAALPLGWQRFPYCMSGDPASADSRCALTQSANMGASIKRLGAYLSETPSTFFSWFFGCALTGLLAGLGAPFWYDTVTGLSKFARGIGRSAR